MTHQPTLRTEIVGHVGKGFGAAGFLHLASITVEIAQHARSTGQRGEALYQWALDKNSTPAGWDYVVCTAHNGEYVHRKRITFDERILRTGVELVEGLLK